MGKLFKSLWSKYRKRYQPKTEIELEEQKLRWAKACRAVRTLDEYEDFEDWLHDICFNYLDDALTKEDLESLKMARIFYGIVDRIKGSSDIIEAGETNLALLKEKSEVS